MDIREFARLAVAVPVPFVAKGRDWSGWDCYGLVCCLYRDVFGVELRGLGDAYRDTKSARIPDLVRHEQRSCWIEVRVPVPGDVVILLLRRRPWHCAVALGAGQMLHVDDDGIGTRTERIASLNWRGRLDGFWRHELLA